MIRLLAGLFLTHGLVGIDAAFGVDIATGADAGASPHVKVFDGATLTLLQSFFAYPGAFTGGVRVAAGDVNGDGTADLITGTGAGSTHVKVFDGVTQAEIRSFFAYPGFTGGVFVAGGDVNNDGHADLVTGADAGGGPHVKVFDGMTNAEIKSFFAYPGAFTGGVRVAAGDVNGDGAADLITGAGVGGATHVKVLDGQTGALIRSFLAYAGFNGGVFVAAGDVTGDGHADIITGADAGAASHVKVFDGVSNAVIQSFFAFSPSFMGGVRVAAGDVDGDGTVDVITGTGPGGAQVTVFDGQTQSTIRNFIAYTGFDGGVFVAAAVAICGNGSVETGEECDDANTAPGDCCDGRCQFESAGSPCADTEPDNGFIAECDGNGQCDQLAVVPPAAAPAASAWGLMMMTLCLAVVSWFALPRLQDRRSRGG